MTTLSLEASKLVYELIGDYETEKCHVNVSGMWRLSDTLPGIPAPTFSELIRVLPRIDALQSSSREERRDDILTAQLMVELYMDAPSEPEGMKAVEEYLIKLLK